jgi:F0F1-type ATP synthase assembly protein I
MEKKTDPSKGLSTVAPQQQFIASAVSMSWQLAIAVLVPVIGGVELDKALTSSDIFLFVGLAVALLASAGVMWHAMQHANRMPVPKLTAAQKRAVQKSYEEEDKD